MTDLLLGALRLEMCPISTYLLLLLLLLYFMIYLKLYFKLLLLFAVNFTYFSKLNKVSLLFFYKKNSSSSSYSSSSSSSSSYYYYYNQYLRCARITRYPRAV